MKKNCGGERERKGEVEGRGRGWGISLDKEMEGIKKKEGKKKIEAQ